MNRLQIRKMMQDFDVNINVPKNGESEEIVVTGSVEDVDATLAEIQDRIEKYNLEADDRVRHIDIAQLIFNKMREWLHLWYDVFS